MRSKPAKNTKTSAPFRPAKSDRFTLSALMAVGAFIAIERTVSFVLRLVSITGTGPHAVLLTPSNLGGEIPLGPAGGPLEIDVRSGYVTLESLSSAELGLLITQETLTYVAILTVIASLTALGRNTLRGRIFNRLNTSLITIAGLAAAFAFSFNNFFGQMASNEIISRLAPGNLSIYGVAGSQLPFFIGLFAFGIVLSAYAVGARLQRETEGLV